MSSTSMEPSIPPGSLMILRRATAGSLQLGDVISVQSPEQPDVLVTHRIVGIEQTAAGPAFTTRGDGNPENDPWLVPATGEGWKFAFYVPALGRLVSGMQSPLGRALFTAGIVLVAALVIIERWRPRRTPAQAAG
jgi:signal peptidase